MRIALRLATALLALFVAVTTARADEEAVPLDNLPKAVTDAVAIRFPKVEMKEASKEKDGDKVVFEVSLKKDGKNIDVTVTEAGVITLIEQQIEFKDLPKAVAKAFEDKYSKATYEIVETVTKVADGKETLDYFEAKLTDADKKKWEVEVTPDGKIKAATEVKEEKKEEKKK